MHTTGKTMAAACAGALLLACGGPRQQPAAEPPAFLGADAYYALGRAEHAARRPALARRGYALALQVDPAHADARNGMAVLLAEQGDYGAAVQIWRALVGEAAALPAAERAFRLGNLGYALYLQGERAEALAMLEQACVLDPYRPVAWEQLAGVLAATGDTQRALQMTKQARMLRSHDIRQDYALTGAAVPAATAPAASAEPRETPWPAGLARTEVVQAGAVVEVRRVAAVVPAPAAAAPAATVATAVKLEISNGNGVRGMAAAWARRLREPAFAAWPSLRLTNVRLTNVKPFAVPVSRIEYRDTPDIGKLAQALAARLGMRAMPAGGTADLRIVLGWDQRADVGLARKSPRKAAGWRPDAG